MAAQRGGRHKQRVQKARGGSHIPIDARACHNSYESAGRASCCRSSEWLQLGPASTNGDAGEVELYEFSIAPMGSVVFTGAISRRGVTETS